MSSIHLNIKELFLEVFLTESRARMTEEKRMRETNERDIFVQLIDISILTLFTRTIYSIVCKKKSIFF